MSNDEDCYRNLCALCDQDMRSSHRCSICKNWVCGRCFDRATRACISCAFYAPAEGEA